MQLCCGQLRACVFLGGLRAGEIVIPSDAAYDASCHLSMGDVRVDSTVNPSFVEVTLKASKTDPFRHGVSVYLGRTDSDLCPVAAVLGYIVSRGTAPGPFFIFEDGRCLTRDRFVSAVRSALRTAGI